MGKLWLVFVHSAAFGFISRYFLVLLCALFGVLTIAWTLTKKWNGGYKFCWHCLRPIPQIRLHFHSRPFCSFSCIQAYEGVIGREALSRLRRNTSGEVLIEEALMYAAALGVSGGVYRYFHHVLWVIFNHVVKYAGCSAPPGAC